MNENGEDAIALEEAKAIIEGEWGYACVEADAVYVPAVHATPEWSLRRVLALLHERTGHTRIIFSAVLNPDALRRHLRHIVREWDEYVPEMNDHSYCIEIRYEPVANLPTMAELRQQPNAPPKGVPRQLAKERKQKSKDDQASAFRDEVWARDSGKCRATGTPLLRHGTIDDTKLGEVDHSIPRSLAPERIYDTSNGLLLQKRLNRLRKAACVHAPEFKYFDYTGPENRALPQHFVWRDDDGKVTKETRG